jgi:hypothetical protein
MTDQDTLGGQTTGRTTPTRGSIVAAILAMGALALAGLLAVWLLFGWIATTPHEFDQVAVELERELDRPSDPDRFRATQLAGALGEAPPRVAVNALRRAIQSSQPSALRQTALMSFARLAEKHDLPPLPLFVDELASLLVDDQEDRHVQELSAYLLGFLEDRAAVPALTGALNHPSSSVRYNAAVALARLGSEASLSTLREMLSAENTAADDDARRVLLAFKGLDALSRRRPEVDFSSVLDVVRRQTESRNIRVRSEARGWLARRQR